MPGEIKFNYPMFTDQIEPKGRLTYDKRSHAAWWYYMLADKNRVKVGAGPESQVITMDDNEEVPLWMDKQYDQIARSVAMIYQLESPDEFIPFFRLVIQEADRLGFKVHPELLSPFGVGKDNVT